jgi:hypothetical protein
MPARATALFADRHAAHAAIEQLVQAGFTRDAISIVMTEDTLEREFGAPPSDRSGVWPARAARAARQGVLASIVLGLARLARTGGLAVHGAGPLVASLLTADDACALSPALVAAGLEENEARSLDEGLRGGSIAVSVHASSDRARLARQLLELSGGAALEAA